VPNFRAYFKAKILLTITACQRTWRVLQPLTHEDNRHAKDFKAKILLTITACQRTWRVLQPLTHEDNRHAKGQPRWRLALVLRYLYKEQMFKAAWRKQNPAVLLHRMEAVNSLATDTACRFVQRQKMHLPGDPQITLRGCYPEKTILLHHT